MRPSTRTLIEEVAARYGVEPEVLLSHRHPRLLLAARVEVAKALDARGYNGQQIGSVLRRDRSMAYFYLGHHAKKPQIKPPKPKPVKVEPADPRRPIPYAGWDRTEVLR